MVDIGEGLPDNVADYLQRCRFGGQSFPGQHVGHTGYEEANREGSGEEIAPGPPVMAEQVHTLRRSARLRGIAPEPLGQGNTSRRSGTAHNHGEKMHREVIDEEGLDK